MRTYCTYFIAAVLLTGCGVGSELELSNDSDELLSDDVSTAEAPLLGAGAGDSADRLCHAVLREVGRPTTATGYETSCVDGKCYFVWAGTFDVSKEAVALSVRGYVLYESSMRPGTWYKTTAARVTGAPAGFQRYRFRITRYTVDTGMSTTSLNNTRIKLIPYVQTLTDSARHFDHNRVIADTGSYVLNQYNGFSLGNDANVCKPAPSRGTLNFTATELQTLGTLKAGGALTVHYDLSRLPNCRNTHNGFPAWDTVAYVKFLPSNQIVSQSIRAFETTFGTPTNVSYAVPFTTTIPAGSTGAEVWFNNFSGAGSTCSDWDSQGGQNYRVAF